MNNIGLNFQGAEQIQNINKAPKQEEKPAPAPTDTTETKPQEFSKEAADAMKANVLYTPTTSEMPKTEEKETDTTKTADTAESTDTAPIAEKEVAKEEPAEMKEYIPQGATAKDVRDILADKKKVGRSFLGYKKLIRKAFEKSQDPQTSIDNLNLLLNAKDGKLNATFVASIFTVAESINNNDKNAEQFKKYYGIDSGKLDNESIDKLTNKMSKDIFMASLIHGLATAAASNASNDAVQQQMFQQQLQLNNDMMMQQQNLINQQTIQPPMGF